MFNTDIIDDPTDGLYFVGEGTLHNVHLDMSSSIISDHSGIGLYVQDVKPTGGISLAKVRHCRFASNKTGIMSSAAELDIDRCEFSGSTLWQIDILVSDSSELPRPARLAVDKSVFAPNQSASGIVLARVSDFLAPWPTMRVQDCAFFGRQLPGFTPPATAPGIWPSGGVIMVSRMPASIDATGNWWDSPLGPFVPGNPNANVAGSYASRGVTFFPFHTSLAACGSVGPSLPIGDN